MNRDFDLVLQGATGFTGRLATEELSRLAPPKLRWAVAGRNPERVQAMAEQYHVPWVVADGLNMEDVDQLASRSRVVLSCSGPFSKYGTLLVRSCVRNRTHYADLTGELPWVHFLIQKFHKRATDESTTLIPCSGFDSVPTDLAVHQLVRSIQADGGNPGKLTGIYRLRGGFNGGTLASGIHLYETWPEVMLPVKGEVFHAPALPCWAAPFLMAPVNEWVVKRSAELLEEEDAGYGHEFQYQEFMGASSKLKAHTLSLTLKTMQGLLRRSWGRTLLRKLGPSPGKGPSEKSRKNGFAKLDLLDANQKKAGTLKMAGDPGNGITVRCLVQTGLSLAAGEARRGGILTPAAALGDALILRLDAQGDSFNRSSP